MLAGCLITGYASDRLGRKTSLLGLASAWSISALAHPFVAQGDFATFLVLQFVLAFASISAWTAAWIWQMEVRLKINTLTVREIEGSIVTQCSRLALWL